MSTEDKAEGAGAGATTPKQPKAKKKMIIIAAAGAALLLGGGGGAYAFLKGGDKAEAAAAEGAHGGGEAAEAGGESHGEGEGEAFVDVPPMVVNLRSADGASRFIKLHFMLVPGTAGGEALKQQLPRLLDAYQPFLRELRPEDLAGSAAVFRIKEEMLIRANDTLGSGRVKDVLIQDLIQQ